ncbi:MAG: response regulator [Clostridia bacterium]|nr:response regulator [Clostridia bacterium]MBQ8971510.1 response regulator [Clostridia bacterium]
MRGNTLLIVDDEIWIRNKLMNRFDWKRFGIDRLLEAEDGEKALAQMRAERVDIVITDMDMPFMDGANMMQAIRSEFPDVQVIVLSGYSDFNTVHGAIVGGAVDYLLKPVQEEQLYAVMEKVTRGIAPESAAGKEGIGLRQIHDYMNSHYAEELSLSVLAERFNLSQSYLSRSFKKEFGVNITTHLTNLRMEAARKLLEEKRLSISQVALSVGYADYAYFSNLFHKQYGCSPREYQKGSKELQGKK